MEGSATDVLQVPLHVNILQVSVRISDGVCVCVSLGVRVCVVTVWLR